MMRARLLAFLFGVAVVFISASAVHAADASGVYKTQSDAYSMCLANLVGTTGRSCVFQTVLTGQAASAACEPPWPVHQGLTSGYGYAVKLSSGTIGSINWVWCAPVSCVSGTSPNGQSDYTFADPGGYMGGGGVVNFNGCCATMDLTDPGFQSAWSAPDKSDATATGHFVLNGNSNCHTNFGSDTSGTIPNPGPLSTYNHCKGSERSCYNPYDDNFCAQSESGEWFCVPRKTPDPGGCISGATGAECLGKDGNPVPPPPNPPISSGTPPDTTNNYTINDGGNTTYYTTNNYSGTSPGPSSSSPPSSSPGGNGSNTNGNGNTGSNGTDSNGNCPDGSKPTASGCSGTYRDDGCNTPPACFGDAVLCGIAVNTHKTACNAASGSSVGSPPSGLDGDPTDNSGDPTSSAVSSSVDLGDATGSLDGSGFGYSSSCPLQDVSFSVFGQSVDIPFADKCDKLAFLKYIVLALAYFMAAKIIAGVQ
jgi:hypothetical protein